MSAPLLIISASAVLAAASAISQPVHAASVRLTIQVLALQRPVAVSHSPTGACRTRFVIGSRESELALVQSRHVAGLLSARFPGCSFEIETSSSAGDDNQTASLDSLAKNNAGLFTKTLEVGLLSKRFDIAVHSLKDMPTTLPPGLCLAAITEREDPEDALVVHPEFAGCQSLDNLPRGSVVGTSSLRRAALLRRKHPHLTPEVVRGNLQTRLAKLDGTSFAGKSYERHFAALILATAGLKRLNWHNRIEAVLPDEEFPYGVGQGALGIECRTGDQEVLERVKSACEHLPSARRCHAERAFLRALQGGCQVPIAVTSTHEDGDPGKLVLHGCVLSLDGAECVEGTMTGPADAPEALGIQLANDFISRGAEKILGDLTQKRPITYSVVAQ